MCHMYHNYRLHNMSHNLQYMLHKCNQVISRIEVDKWHTLHLSQNMYHKVKGNQYMYRSMVSSSVEDRYTKDRQLKLVELMR